MALTEQKKQEWEETLRKGELISVSDKITEIIHRGIYGKCYLRQEEIFSLQKQILYL